MPPPGGGALSRLFIFASVADSRKNMPRSGTVSLLLPYRLRRFVRRRLRPRHSLRSFLGRAARLARRITLASLASPPTHPRLRERAANCRREEGANCRKAGASDERTARADRRGHRRRGGDKPAEGGFATTSRTPRRSGKAREERHGDDRPQGGSRCPDEAAVAEKGHRRLG